MTRTLTALALLALIVSGIVLGQNSTNSNAAPPSNKKPVVNQSSSNIQVQQKLNISASQLSGRSAKHIVLPEGDVLKKIQELNKDKSKAPITTYRKGHVTKHSLAGKAVKKTQLGFEVDLPGNFPIPTPAIYKGKLYVSGGFGSKQFYCLDAATGKPIWAKNLDDDGPTSAVIEDGIVVFNTESCTIFALDASTGKQLWSYWLGDPLASTPAISKGKVYTTYPANAQKGKAQSSHILGCFDLKTGKILWQKWIDGDGMTAPVIEKDTVYLTTFPGTLYKINAESGKILAANNTRATCAPTIVNGDVFFSRRSDKGKEVREAISVTNDTFAKEKLRYNERKAVYLDLSIQVKGKMASQASTLDAGNGFASAPAASGYSMAAKNIGQGRVSSMQSFQGSRILNHAGLNYNCMGDELFCTDPTNGKVKWQIKMKGDLKKVGGFLGTPPALAGKRLVIGTLDGRILLITPKDGKVEKEYKIGKPIRFQPTIENGKIYVGTQDGKLICIDTKDASLTGWPMWGKNAAHTGR